MMYLDIDFPNELALCFYGGAEFATTISKLANKQEICNQNWQSPRYKYYLINKLCNEQNYQKLQNFFLICKGCSTAFNFLDYNDCKIEKQQIAVGDGKTFEFKIYKNYQYENYLFKRRIFKLKNVQLFVDNEIVDETDFCIKHGCLIFNNNFIPPKNSMITIDAVFYIVARFDNDFLPINRKRQSVELPDLCIVEASM